MHDCITRHKHSKSLRTKSSKNRKTTPSKAQFQKCAPKYFDTNEHEEKGISTELENRYSPNVSLIDEERDQKNIDRDFIQQLSFYLSLLSIAYSIT